MDSKILQHGDSYDHHIRVYSSNHDCIESLLATVCGMKQNPGVGFLVFAW